MGRKASRQDGGLGSEQHDEVARAPLPGAQAPPNVSARPWRGGGEGELPSKPLQNRTEKINSFACTLARHQRM